MTALSLIGDDGGLRLRNPSLFAVIERRFEPLRIAFVERSGRAGGCGSASAPPFRSVWPRIRSRLLSPGTVRRYDALSPCEPGPGRWRLALAPGADAPQLSEEVVLRPNRFHAVDGDLHRLSAAARGKNQRRPGGGVNIALEPVTERSCRTAEALEAREPRARSVLGHAAVGALSGRGDPWSGGGACHLNPAGDLLGSRRSSSRPPAARSALGAGGQGWSLPLLRIGLALDSASRSGPGRDRTPAPALGLRRGSRRAGRLLGRPGGRRRRVPTPPSRRRVRVRRRALGRPTVVPRA